MVLDNIEAFFEFDPCTNYLVTPWFLNNLEVTDKARLAWKYVAYTAPVDKNP